MNRTTLLLVAVLVATGCQTTPEWAPSPDEPRAFVSTLGTDTVTVEVFVRDGNVIEGVIVERIPYTNTTEYRVELDEYGHVSSFSINQTTPASNPEGAEPMGASMTIEGDQASIVREGGRNPGESTVTVPQGVIPRFGGASPNSMFVFEQVAHQLQDGGEGVMLVGFSGADAGMNASRVVAADTISMDYFGFSFYGWSDDQGQLLGVSGAATTFKVEVRRIAPFLVGEMAERWAALDAAGEGIGTPSPSATAEATIAGADLQIQYSQPAKRGRDIWGGLVPNGAVWRTGANAAVQFSTSEDLSLGGTDLPAGSYSLWSIYNDGTFELIVNAQTNQWGTQHDPEQDLFRVEMQASELAGPSERFTISISETDDGGQIVFDWDATRYTASFMVK